MRRDIRPNDISSHDISSFNVWFKLHLVVTTFGQTTLTLTAPLLMIFVVTTFGIATFVLMILVLATF
jgi:hypothetical protein